MNDNFLTQKPEDSFLNTLVDYYFYIELSIDQLRQNPEYIIPFPRITFGYFFDHPFFVTNHNLKESRKVEMVISRISVDKITVVPLTEKIRILGAHVKPYTLAHLTTENISKLPWLIDTTSLFGDTALQFRKKIDLCEGPRQMFKEVENVFLKSLVKRNLGTITKAVEIIEREKGNISFGILATSLGLSDRALRDQFYKFIGCTPKEFIQLVRLKQSIGQMRATDDSLTTVSYSSHYFDQPHFINSFKKITGKSPKSLRKEMYNFRFLQF